MDNSEEKRYVILVDENDRETGVMEKIEAHRKGLLHRAFSVFIFNHKGEMLLQQRAMNKYHSAGLWTNACCSHPSPGETLEEATVNRLQQEMGITCELVKQFTFLYKITFDNGLIENEFDHVFAGKSESVPRPDPLEVMNYKWKTIRDIKEDILQNPHLYTEWFCICMQIDGVFSSYSEPV